MVKTNMVIHCLWCTKCRTRRGPFIKHSFNKTVYGKRQYYRCRKCNGLYFKRYYRLNKEKVVAIIRKSERKYPERKRARSLLNSAVAAGKIQKPNKCQFCGKFGRIEGDHRDYTKPLDVVWLCSGCHANQPAVVE